MWELLTVLKPRIGGDGPKLIDLLQMREKHLLQDRIELLGAVRHSDVLSVSGFYVNTPCKILESSDPRFCPVEQSS
jgi:hypothetical protein